MPRYRLLIRETADYFGIIEYYCLMKSKHITVLGRTQGLLHSHSCKDAGHPVPPIFIGKIRNKMSRNPVCWSLDRKIQAKCCGMC